MPHDHSDHHHHHIDPDAGDAKVAWAIAVNMLLTLAQVVGGILSGSLALIADALHNFSDAISLIIAFVARKIARRPADKNMSFGYGRAEVVAALINYTTLVVIALYLGYEGVMRALDPQPIAGWMVVSIASIALVIDLVTAALTYRLSKESMNIRAAFLHNVADALGSVAVIIAGFAVIVLGWDWVDPVVTLMIAGYILWHVYAEIGGVIRVLMLGSPPGIHTEEVIEAILNTPGVEGIHHLHLWQMEESETALQAHVLIAESDLIKQTRIKQDIKRLLLDTFSISHTTLEFEYGDLICENPKLIGH